MSKIF
jgi:dynein heavy chain